MLDALLDRITPVRCLNEGGEAVDSSVEALEVATQLARLRLRLRSDSLSPTLPANWLVDSRARLARLAAPLATMKASDLRDRNARFAFWINVYNSLVAHAVIEASPRTPLRRPWNLYRRYGWRIGGHVLTPDAIEHGVLRANRGHRLLAGPSFLPFDPRRPWVIDPMDPRVHATLHCGVSSCPPVQIYEASRFEDQLQWSWEGWLRSSTTIDPIRRRVRVHPILWSYRGDLGGESGLLDALQRDLDGDEAVTLGTLRREGPLDVGAGQEETHVAL